METLEDILYKNYKRICPSCNESVYPGACAIVEAPDQQIQQALKPAPTGLKRLTSIPFPGPLVGPKYTQNNAAYQCPKCGYAMPYNIDSARSLNIAIVGNTTSGKSVYIASLIRHLEQGQGLLARPDLGQSFTITCLTPKVKVRYENQYWKPLFEDKQVPDPSPRAIETTHEPLIYEISIRLRRDELMKNLNLIIYDTSGEDYVIGTRLVQWARYVLSADGLIFMADPISIPEIFNHLPPNPNLSYGTPAEHPALSLNTITSLVTRSQGKRTGASLGSTPIAITLSKCDLLKKLRAVGNQYYFITQPPRYRGGANLQDIEMVDKEVRQLLTEHGGDNLLLAANNFKKVRFLAVSAIGYTPDAAGKIPTVEPWRCLDPFLWVLYELGLIEAQ